MGSLQRLQSPTLIVDAGVFDASTALYSKRYNLAIRVTLLDRTPYPNPSAASHDLNKIVRADYDDVFYMKLGIETQELWRTDSIYKPYYHECGMFFAEDWGMTKACDENFQTLGVDTGAHMLSPADAKAKFPIFMDAEWAGIEECYYNPKAGWGEAEQAMRAIVDACIAEGVEYRQATVSTLTIENGVCTGVHTEDGQDFEADDVLLCTGARTGKLLADSAPHDNDMQLNGRAVAAAAVSCSVRVDPEHLHIYKDAPVFFNGMDHTHGESIPPLSDGRLKFNYEVSFTNMVHHPASGQTISMPPIPLSQSTWSQDVPEGLKKEVTTVIPHIYGADAKGLAVDSFRMCW